MAPSSGESELDAAMYMTLGKQGQPASQKGKNNGGELGRGQRGWHNRDKEVSHTALSEDQQALLGRGNAELG